MISTLSRFHPETLGLHDVYLAQMYSGTHKKRHPSPRFKPLYAFSTAPAMRHRAYALFVAPPLLNKGMLFKLNMAGATYPTQVADAVAVLCSIVAVCKCLAGHASPAAPAA